MLPPNSPACACYGAFLDIPVEARIATWIRLGILAELQAAGQAGYFALRFAPTVDSGTLK